MRFPKNQNPGIWPYWAAYSVLNSPAFFFAWVKNFNLKFFQIVQLNMKICSIEVFDTSDSENNINQQDSNEKKKLISNYHVMYSNLGGKIVLSYWWNWVFFRIYAVRTETNNAFRPINISKNKFQKRYKKGRIGRPFTSGFWPSY